MSKQYIAIEEEVNVTNHKGKKVGSTPIGAYNTNLFKILICNKEGCAVINDDFVMDVSKEKYPKTYNNFYSLYQSAFT